MKAWIYNDILLFYYPFKTSVFIIMTIATIVLINMIETDWNMIEFLVYFMPSRCKIT